MPYSLVSTQNADRSLAANATVWTGTVTDLAKYSFRVVIGDGTKNLSGTGGTYLLTLIVDGVTYRGGSEQFAIGTASRAEIQTEEFVLPASAVVSFKVYSPNAGETDVDCTASLYQEVGATQVTALAIKAKTDLIGTGAINGSSPVSDTGVISPIVIGDDYLAANGRAFTWTVDKPSGFSLTNAMASFGASNDDAEGWLVTGTITDNGDDTLLLSFDLEKDDTAGLNPTLYRWSVEIADATGVEITQVRSGKNLVQLVDKQT